MNKMFGKIRSGVREARGQRGQGGFSLIEMLVAMGIFMIFTGILITSYIGIVRSLQGAEEYRILYSEARHVFDVLTENSRNMKIFYEDGSGERQTSFPVSEQTSLSFYSVDGLKKVTFSYVPAEGSKLEMRSQLRSDVYVTFGGGLMDEEELYSDEVRIVNFKFYVWPLENPFEVYGTELANLFHPKVTFVATFEKDNPKGGVYTLDLQTSVSLRIYN